MKKFINSIILASAAIFASAAYADTYVTPLVGYQFQTSDTIGKQEKHLGEFQKNNSTYGVQVTNDTLISNQEIGVEYLRTDSNLDSYQVGVVAYQPLGSSIFYATEGVGYTKLEGTHKNQEGAYFNVGVGAKKLLTNFISVKTELRGQFASESSQWTPVALVGFEFNTNQISKPYSK